MPDLLDLPAPVIEQIAKVRLDENIDYYHEESKELRPKRFCFWVLREVGHRGVHAAAWEARHAVVRPDLKNVAVLGDTEWCRVLLDAGADVHAEDDIALIMTAGNGHAATVKVLLDAGANVHAQRDASLFRASEHGHPATLKVLLDAGADVHTTDDWALRWASRAGHTATVKVLLDAGANIHAENDDALRKASQNGHTATVELLLERGADASVLES